MMYKGNTPVKAGDMVELIIDDEVWAEAKVIDALAVQFTCRIQRQPLARFYFYEDKGVTWRKVQ